MTDQQHPITLPPGVVEQWVYVLKHHSDAEVFNLAAQLGADMELEECWRWMRDEGYRETAQLLHAARRPNPPSLKEQALTALHAVATGANDTREQHQDLDTIRKALEALPND